MDKINPGNIIIKDFGNFPVYGIVLPKEKFLNYFEKEKGKWPKGKFTDELKRKFGHYLPVTDKEILQGKKSFFDKNYSLIGAKMLGDFYEDFSKRELGFEIFPTYNLSGQFSPQDSPLIIKIREKCSYEFGTPPEITPSPHTELKWLQQYFSGEYLGKSTHKYEDSLSSKQKNLIDLLRDCKIPEKF